MRAQALFDPLQFCFAAGGPDDLLDAHIVDAACPGVSCARKHIWRPPGVKTSRLQLVQRDKAFEHIAVEVHRTIQVGLSRPGEGCDVWTYLATDVAHSGLLCEGATGIGGIQGSQRRYRGTVEPCARAEIATLI